jgi:histidine triad (HIT) family protein
MDCIFCKIANREIPATLAYEDETAVAFADLNPQAPVHVLVVPRKHIPSLAEIGDSDADLLGHLCLVTAKLAKQAGLADGYRTVLNTGENGGQTVMHLHIHLLGGRAMHWPPG